MRFNNVVVSCIQNSLDEMDLKNIYLINNPQKTFTKFQCPLGLTFTLSFFICIYIYFMNVIYNKL